MTGGDDRVGQDLDAAAVTVGDDQRWQGLDRVAGASQLVIEVASERKPLSA
jgi:hypothetical protein